MKNTFFLFTFMFSFILSANGQTGYVSEKLKMKSEILEREVNYSIYLPADYDSSELNYPVLYLLHGYTDDHTSWIQFGLMNRILDNCIHDNTVPAMIVIMPDAGVGWYVNDANKKECYEDMFIKELIPYIDKNYHTLPKKEFRAIAGISMGGYGSLLYSLKHPDLFAACCSLSGGILTDNEIKDLDEERYKIMLSPFYQASSNRLTEHWYKNSTLRLVERMDNQQKKSVRFYLDCGDDDFLFEGNSLLHIAMRKNGIPHEYRVRDGDHSWEYWRAALPEILRFVGSSFHR